MVQQRRGAVGPRLACNSNGVEHLRRSSWLFSHLFTLDFHRFSWNLPGFHSVFSIVWACPDADEKGPGRQWERSEGIGPKRKRSSAGMAEPCLAVPYISYYVAFQSYIRGHLGSPMIYYVIYVINPLAAIGLLLFPAN